MSLSRQQRRAAERAARKKAHKAEVAQASACDWITDNGEPTTPSGARRSANRANATDESAPLSKPKTQEKLSTGPRTQEGKAASSRNSFKHGLYSKQLVVKGEDPAELDALKADLIAEHQPGNLTEAILVNEMAEHYWRLKRYRRLEAMLMQGDSLVIPQMAAVQRFMNAAERGFHKSLKTLRELQKARGFVPAICTAQAASQPVPATMNGFVPPKLSHAEGDRLLCPAAPALGAERQSCLSPLLDDDAAFKAECEMFERHLKAA